MSVARATIGPSRGGATKPSGTGIHLRRPSRKRQPLLLVPEPSDGGAAVGGEQPAGNRCQLRSHGRQAQPPGADAPAVELAVLLESEPIPAHDLMGGGD